jgi:hypothetical protein
MRKLTNFGSALVFAVLVASGMVAMTKPVAAAGGPGGGRSGEVLCRLLAEAEAAALTLPDSDFKTSLLATIDEQQASLGCQ